MADAATGIAARITQRRSTWDRSDPIDPARSAAAAHRRAYPALAALWGARLLRFAPERAVERCCAFAAVFADADADVAARAAAWEATPWPRDRDDAAAREKLACAELAAGRPLDDCAARDSDDSESELTTFTLNDAASLASYGVFAPE